LGGPTAAITGGFGFDTIGDLLTGNDKVRAGLAAQKQAIAEAKGEINPIYEGVNQAYEPYAQMGQGLAGLQQRAQAGAFDPRNFQFQQDPGQQFAMQQGLQAGERGLAAMGLTGSGRAGKELSRFATGLAGQQYGQSWERNRLGQQQRYGQEFGLGQLGLGALGQQQQSQMGLAGILRDLAIGKGQAQADAYGARAASQRGLVGDIFGLGGKAVGAALGGM
jgi:hypothetical protein